jgi:outer membrane autotransporter protein
MGTNANENTPALRPRLISQAVQGKLRNAVMATSVATIGVFGGSYSRYSFAGSCADAGSGIFICSDPLDPATDTSQALSADTLTVTTTALFSINSADNYAFDLSAGTGRLIFEDNNTSIITGADIGIFAINNGSDELSISSTGALTGTGNTGVRAYNFGTDLTINAAAATGGRVGIDTYNGGSGVLSIITTGAVSGTTRDGIYAYNSGTDLIINAATATGGKSGIYAVNGGSGVLSIITTGAVSGTTRNGIYARNNGTNLTINTAASSGKYGIYAKNNGMGALSITSTGPVTGTGSQGIYAINSTAGSDLTINAVTVSGEDKGVSAINNGSGALSITSTGAVTATNSDGINAVNEGTNLTISTAAVTGGYDGINAINNGSGALTITSTSTVTGTSSSGIYVSNSAAGSDLTISAAAVSGDTRGIDAKNAGSGFLRITTTGAITGIAGINASNNSATANSTSSVIIQASGSVTGTGGTAIRMSTNNTHAATVDNAGSITGNVTFDDGDDTFIHRRAGVSNVFDDDSSIDFGAGNDTFVNATILQGFASQLPTLSDLEIFANAGELRLQNGTANDVFEINHNFEARTGSRLSVDVDFANNTADQLKITGTVTGTTEVTLNPLAGAEATANNLRIVEVDGAAGAAAEDAFVLAADSAEIGLFIYELANEDTATGDDFVLTRAVVPVTPTVTTSPGVTAATDTPGVTAATDTPAPTVAILTAKASEIPVATAIVQEVFQDAIPRYHDRIQGRQMLESAGDMNIWVVAIANDLKLDSGIEVNIDHQNVLIGLEGSLNDWYIGGYFGATRVAADLAFNGDIDVNGATAGLYANTGDDNWFVDLAVEIQYSDLEYDSNNVAIGELNDNLSVYGFGIEGGYSLYKTETDNLMVTGRYLYGKGGVDFGDVQGVNINAGNDTSSRVAAGIRWERDYTTSRDLNLQFALHGSVIHDTEGSYDTEIAGATVNYEIGDTWGVIAASISIQTSDNSTTYIRANMVNGGDRSGGGVTFGYRYQF